MILGTALLVAASGVVDPQIALAQKEDKGKEIARGLLKALIESQLDRQGRNSFEPGRPGQPGIVTAPQRPQPTAEMLQVRQVLASVAQESAILSAQMSTDARQSFEARNLQPDVLRFQATATATQQRAALENNHVGIQLPIQTLDQTWKPLAHQLLTTRGVSTRSRECMERINGLNGQLCQIYGIREQFNRRELVRAADLLEANIQTLTDEVSYAGSAAANRNQLLNRMRRLQEQSSSFANLSASGAQFQAVVAEYQSLFQAWQALRPSLDPFTSRTITRAVSRIQDTHRTIHQLLRIDFGIDEVLVQRMAEVLQRDIADLYRTITLEQIMTLPDSRSLPVAADTLFGMSHNLTDVVTRREPIQTVAEAWLYLDEQWHLFEFYLQPIRTPETCRRVEGLSQSIGALKNAIGISVAFDRNEILRQTAALESLTEHLHQVIHRWLSRPGQQVPGLVEKSHQLEELCAELSAMANISRDKAALRAKCDELLVVWQQTRPELSKCETEDREPIEQIVDDFIPALIRLRTMMED